MAVVNIQAYACERCNYRWTPRDFPVTTKVRKATQGLSQVQDAILEPSKNAQHSSRESGSLQGVGNHSSRTGPSGFNSKSPAFRGNMTVTVKRLTVAKGCVRVVIYVRVSSKNQDIENSAEAQIAECKAYIEKMGWTLVGIYIDKSQERPRRQTATAQPDGP